MMAEKLVDQGIWRWLGADGERERGRAELPNLSVLEEMDIANAPRPIKTEKQAAAELALQAERRDPDVPADLVPMSVTSMASGVPVVREEMLRRGAGDRALSQAEHRWQLRLAAMERQQPIQYHLLVLRFVDHRSDRDIARGLGISHPMVGRMIARAELALLAEYQDLFGHGPLDK